MTATTTRRGIQLLTAADVEARSAAWLAARGQGIGASEIAAAMGLSPWDSPFSLYWRKKLATQTEMSEAMEWGLRHERAIAEKFAENHPELHLASGGLYRHAEHQWMLATPDRLACDHLCLQTLDDDPATWGPCAGCRATALVQIKTAHSFDGWGEPGTDQVPVYYRAQVQQEMAVYGATRCWIPVLVAGNSYREYVVDYDQADVEAIVAAGAEFMRRLAADEPPDIDGSASTLATLKALHPSVIDEPVTVPLPLADQYRVRKDLLDDAKAAYDEVCNQIRAAIGDYRYAVADGRKVAQRSVFERRDLDRRAFKADHPELYAQYETTSLVDVLKPVKEKL